MDEILHEERLLIFGGTLEPARLAALPDGAYVTEGKSALLLAAGRLHEWTPGSYQPIDPVGRSGLRLLTPPSTIAAFLAGFAPDHGELIARKQLRFWCVKSVLSRLTR